MSKIAWTRLIRFEATDGRILRGEPNHAFHDNETDEFDLGKISEADQLQARVITGEDIFNTTGNTIVTDEVVTVKRLLGPLRQADVPIIRCVGLNYAKHSKSRAIR